jgi:hypothetical protein
MPAHGEQHGFRSMETPGDILAGLNRWLKFLVHVPFFSRARLCAGLHIND